VISPALSKRVEQMLGHPIAAVESPRGGYSTAERHVAHLVGGRTVFVKAATCEKTAEWLRIEAVVYQQVQSSFLPQLIAYESVDPPILVLESLHTCRWPPPWNIGDVDAVLGMLAALQDIAVPDELPDQQDVIARSGGGPHPWDVVARDPEPFLRLGVCSPKWLERALPQFLAAQQKLDFSGTVLVHNDLRSDNLCFRDRHPLLVDWSWAARGHPGYDASRWAASLVVEGVTKLPHALKDDALRFAVWHAGNWGHQAPIVLQQTTAWALKLAQLRVALEFAAEAVELPPPA
jgi:hypothetical protein